MKQNETFTDLLKAIGPGESREWTFDHQEMTSKRQLVSRLNQRGYSFETKYVDGVFTVTNTKEA